MDNIHKEMHNCKDGVPKIKDYQVDRLKRLYG